MLFNDGVTEIRPRAELYENWNNFLGERKGHMEMLDECVLKGLFGEGNLRLLKPT